MMWGTSCFSSWKWVPVPYFDSTFKRLVNSLEPNSERLRLSVTKEVGGDTNQVTLASLHGQD